MLIARQNTTYLGKHRVRNIKSFPTEAVDFENYCHQFQDIVPKFSRLLKKKKSQRAC